jgi:hypothetical protein
VIQLGIVFVYTFAVHNPVIPALGSAFLLAGIDGLGAWGLVRWRERQQGLANPLKREGV